MAKFKSYKGFYLALDGSPSLESAKFDFPFTTHEQVWSDAAKEYRAYIWFLFKDIIVSRLAHGKDSIGLIPDED
jgi:hypothetical protein